MIGCAVNRERTKKDKKRQKKTKKEKKQREKKQREKKGRPNSIYIGSKSCNIVERLYYVMRKRIIY